MDWYANQSFVRDSALLNMPILFPIEVDGKHGYIDRGGSVVIPPRFDLSNGFSEDLAPTVGGGRWGYIDPKGRWAIPPMYGEALDFRDGLASVMVDGRWGCIDSCGRMVIPPCSDTCISFSEGLAAVCDAGVYRYINSIGFDAFPLRIQARSIPGGYEFRAGRFSESFSSVCDSDMGLWGLIDRGGKYAIYPQYQEMWPVSGGLMVVREKKSGPRRYVDCTGRNAFMGQRFRNASGFSEGLAAVEIDSIGDGGYGFIDLDGRWVIPPQYFFAFDFSEGLAPVEFPSERGFGVIDRTGAVVVPPRPGWTVFPFSDGLATFSVERNQDRWGYIDKTGNIVWASNG